MGAAERAIRDRVAETLAEIERLELRPLFGGFGMYVDGLLVAAAWDEAFRLRCREQGRWVYRPVDDALLDDPDALVPVVREHWAELSQLPEARRRRTRGTGTTRGG